MYTNNIALYEGEEPFIFISYAHKDSEKVLPIVARLQQNGFRVWYDAGIEAGSEWPENVAEHLLASGCVVAFITPNAVASVNCRREINFAISEEKPLLAINLEETELSAGMKLQLNSQQQMFYNRHADEDSFFNSLCQADMMQSCRGEAVESTGRKVVKLLQNVEKDEKRTFELTVFSPINVDIYLNSDASHIMKIDKYSGFDYKYNNITTGEEFTLIFKAKNLEKRVTLKAPEQGGSVEYRLHAILSELDILSTYDREEAWRVIELKPCGYAFEQIENVGKAEDVDRLLEQLDELQDAYVVARCMRALGELARKYKRDVVAEMVAVYVPYERKPSYAYLFEEYLPKDIVAKFKEKK